MLAVLLPPSEGKAPGGGRPRWRPGSGRFRRLAGPRAAVADALRELGGGDERLLGARGELLERARVANRSLIDSPTLPSWQRFTGVVWEHVAPTELDVAATERAEQSVFVVSAVTGVSAWSDPIPDFRCKLSVSLAPLGRLDRFWTEAVSEVLNGEVRDRLVVDLLPNEHRAAWVPDPDRYELVRPVLATADGKPAGHGGKATKGRLARALLESGDPARTLATFDPDPLTMTLERPADP